MKLPLVLPAFALVSIAVLGACGGGSAAPAATPTATPTRAAPSATKAATTSTAAASPVQTFCGPTPNIRPEPDTMEMKLDNPVTTTTGLKYQDRVVGTGATPLRTQTVCVHYTGRLASNGKKFDSSLDRGAPSAFALTQVVAGFSEGILTMKVGGKRTLLIPSALGYGAQGRPPQIPANADLIFDVELISIKP